MENADLDLVKELIKSGRMTTDVDTDYGYYGEVTFKFKVMLDGVEVLEDSGSHYCDTVDSYGSCSCSGAGV